MQMQINNERKAEGRKAPNAKCDVIGWFLDLVELSEACDLSAAGSVAFRQEGKAMKFHIFKSRLLGWWMILCLLVFDRNSLRRVVWAAIYCCLSLKYERSDRSRANIEANPRRRISSNKYINTSNGSGDTDCVSQPRGFPFRRFR